MRRRRHGERHPAGAALSEATTREIKRRDAAIETTPVRYEVTDHVAIITLNRPEPLNAVNADLSTALGASLEKAAADAVIRVVVLTGNGRAFCAGADLKAIADQLPIDSTDHPDWGFGGMVRHWIDKPVIAAVNGAAMGGGAELVLACDLVVAGRSARFGLPEVKRGLLAAAGGVVRLQQQVPMKLAMELALTGEPIDAATAKAWGLVNRVADDDTVLQRALELAATIAANAPLSVQYTKQLMHRLRAAGSDWESSWSFEDPWAVKASVTRAVFGSRDAFEGANAFAQKREPVWEGR